MSRSKGKRQEKLNKKSKKDSRLIPVGKWVDVPRGMVAAPGTYVDHKGVMRSSYDDSVVAWHHVNKKTGYKCHRVGLQPDDLVYDPETNAPWCPSCWRYEVKSRYEKIFSDIENNNKN